MGAYIIKENDRYGDLQRALRRLRPTWTVNEEKDSQRGSRKNSVDEEEPKGRFHGRREVLRLFSLGLAFQRPQGNSWGSGESRVSYSRPGLSKDSEETGGGRESKGSLPLAWPSKGLRGAMGR